MEETSDTSFEMEEHPVDMVQWTVGWPALMEFASLVLSDMQVVVAAGTVWTEVDRLTSVRLTVLTE